MTNYLIGLALLLIFANIIAYNKLMKGAPFCVDPDEWGFEGYGELHVSMCIIGGVIYTAGYQYFGKASEFVAFNGVWVVFILLGGGAYILNCLFSLYVVNSIVKAEVAYKRACLRLGVDTNEYVGRYFVLTHKSGWGSVNQVSLYKVKPLKSYAGDFSELHKVSQILDSEKLPSKKEIKIALDNWFDSRNIYLVEGNTIIEQDKNKLDIIIVGDN